MNTAYGVLTPGMELRHLRYFLAVADEGTFTRAAARLFVAQPALSRQVRDLERHVGAPLFVRGSRGAALTDAGRRLLPRARRVVAEFDRVLAEARRGPNGSTGRVRLGVNIDLARRVTPVIARLAAALPGIRIDPVVYGADGAAALLVEGEIDAAVTWWTAPGWEARAVERFRAGLGAGGGGGAPRRDPAHDGAASLTPQDLGARVPVALFDPSFGAAAHEALADLVRGAWSDPELITEPMDPDASAQAQMIDLARRRGAGTVVARQNLDRARLRGMVVRPLELPPVPVTLIRPGTAADEVELVVQAAGTLAAA